MSDSRFMVLSNVINKSEYDFRDYKIIRLKNGLEALIVHDPAISSKYKSEEENGKTKLLNRWNEVLQGWVLESFSGITKSPRKKVKVPIGWRHSKKKKRRLSRSDDEALVLPRNPPFIWTHTIEKKDYIFVIEIDLTDFGLLEINNIIGFIYAYLHLLRDSPQEWIFEEIQTIGNMKFNFEDETQLNYAIRLSENMLFYPPEHVISATYVCKKWDEEMIK
ncbi:Insulinase (Peptidase family M16) family protein [Trifolium repens]|nr:Insulinase (Peptidase family M16) family protein [Trifolium repens]